MFTPLPRRPRRPTTTRSSLEQIKNTSRPRETQLNRVTTLFRPSTRRNVTHLTRVHHFVASSRKIARSPAERCLHARVRRVRVTIDYYRYSYCYYFVIIIRIVLKYGLHRRSLRVITDLRAMFSRQFSRARTYCTRVRYERNTFLVRSSTGRSCCLNVGRMSAV